MPRIANRAMKFFIDTANIEEIKSALDMGIISGITTNPTLIAREKTNPDALIRQILTLADNCIVNVEVNRLDSEGMIEEAREISKLGPNVVVKIPMTPEGLKAVKVLSKEGVNTNVTLVFSASQALTAYNAGAKYTSVFLGRLEDIGTDGLAVVRDVKAIFRQYGITTNVVAASIRSVLHVIECAKANVDIVTMPYKVLAKLTQHVLTDDGLARFVSDWKALNQL